MILRSLLPEYITSRATRPNVSEFAKVVVGLVVSVVGSFAVIKVTTRYMTPEIFSKIPLANTVAMFMSLLFFGPLGNGVERYAYALFHKKQMGAVVCRLLLLMAIFIIPALLGFSLIGRSSIIGLSCTFIVLSYIYAVVSGFQGVFASIFAALRERIKYAAVTAVVPWAKICLYPFFLSFPLFIFDANSVLLSWIAGAALLIVVQLFLYGFRVEYNAKVDLRAEYRGILKYSAPFAVWAIPQWLQLNSDLWIVQAKMGSGALAGYAIIWQLSYSLALLAQSVVTKFFVPILFQKIDPHAPRTVASIQRSHRIVKLMATGYVCSVGPLIVMAAVIPTGLIAFFSTGEYTELSRLFIYMLAGYVLFCFGDLLSLQCAAFAKNHYYIPLKIACPALLVPLYLVAASHNDIGRFVYYKLLVAGLYAAGAFMLNGYVRKVLLRRAKEVDGSALKEGAADARGGTF